MSWAERAIAELANGRETTVRPRDYSMQPKVRSGACVWLEPVHDVSTLRRGKIVLVGVGRRGYLHLISATDTNGVQISNNRGHVNGWVSRTAVHGRAPHIDITAT